MPTDPARALAGAIEPFAGQVYFSPECHQAYEGLGFGPSPHRTRAGVALPDGVADFVSRAASMGQVDGKVAASAFGVFDPVAVELSLTLGWSLTDPGTIGAARTAGASAQLVRTLGPSPEGVDEVVDLLRRAGDSLDVAGRPLFAGMASVALPDDPLAAAGVLADRLREYRGDSHTAAWTSAGYGPTEISVITELWVHQPIKTYSRTRGWSDDALDTAIDALRTSGDLDGDELSAAGRARRDAVEVATDLPCHRIVANLGDDLDVLLGLVRPLSASLQAAGGYPAFVLHR